MQSRGEIQYADASTHHSLTADATFRVDLRCHPLRVIYRTCYALTDRAYLWLEWDEPDGIVVAITRKNAADDLQVMLGDFANALVDFSLRDQIAAETSEVRNALVSGVILGINKW